MNGRGRVAAFPGVPFFAVVLALAACGSPTPTPPGTGPDATAPTPGGASASTQVDGVIVTLALSAERVAAGGRIRVGISALNAGLGPVSYMSGGCGPIMGIAIGGPPVAGESAGVPPGGQGWEAALALARWSALSQAGPGLDWIRSPNLPDDAAMACTADLAYDQIETGAAFTDEAVWIARSQDGAPAPAGAYTVTLEFPYAGRRARDEVQLDGTDTPPIRVTVPLTVEPGPEVATGSAAAIDAAIADPRVRAWAERSLSRERLSGATIALVDGRWRFRIMVEGGQTDAYIDPATGRVTEVLAGP